MANEIKEGVLYLVGTPIGNLADITLRALDTLKGVDVIACEDTRHSMILLKKYNICKPLLSYHKHNEAERSEKIITALTAGKSVALITDAGMPCISDPGAVLVSRARFAGCAVVVVPGPSAVISAVSLGGMTGGRFVFLGFLPEKRKELEEALSPFVNSDISIVVYTSPYDINKDVKRLHLYLGERRLTVVKELTKMHERLTESVLSEFHEDNPRGEYVLLVGERLGVSQCEKDYKSAFKEMLDNGEELKTAIKSVAKRYNMPRDEVYKYALSLKKSTESN